MAPTVRAALSLTVTAVLALTVTGCAPERPPGAEARDAQIFAAVDKVPGVVSQTLGYQDNFAAGIGYSGTVDIAPGADPECVMDAVAWLLAYNGSGLSSVSVTQDGEWLRWEDLGLPRGRQEWEARYAGRTSPGDLLPPPPPPGCPRLPMSVP